jgi:hypothetical protein
MPNTIEQVDAFLRDPANKNRHQGDGWHNRCEQFVNNAGKFTQAFGTALAAGNASGPLDPRLSTITDGSIGYWRGVWIRINGVLTECGHTAFWYHGKWEMASDAVTTMIGDGTGTISAADYARLRPAAIWRGHTKRHGTETLAPSPKPIMKPKPTPASTGATTPISTPEEEDEEMILFQGKNDAKIYELKNGQKRWISAAEYEVLQAANIPVHRNIPAASVAKIPNA